LRKKLTPSSSISKISNSAYAKRRDRYRTIAATNDSDRADLPGHSPDSRDLPRADAGALSLRHDSHSKSFRIGILPGTDIARRRQRYCLHDIFRRRLRIRCDSFLSRPRVEHESRVALLRVNDDRNAARSRSDPIRQGERALHILSAAPCASSILYWTHAHSR